MEFTAVGLLFDNIGRFSWTCAQMTGEGAAQLNQSKPVSIHCVTDMCVRHVNLVC